MIHAFLLTLVLQAAPPIEVPIELVSNRPYVELRLEGSRPLPFCLDTGAAQATLFVDLSTARELGLQVGALRRSHMGAGEGLEIESGEVQALTFALGGREMRAPTPGVLDLSALGRFDGRPTRGLLGGGFLGNWLVELDYPALRLRLHDRRTRVVLDEATRGPRAPRRYRIPFELQEGFITVLAELTPRDRDPIPARFVVDTGARMTLVCSTPFVEAHDLVGAIGTTEPFPIGHGAGGECRGTVGRAAELRVGDLRFDDELVYLSSDRSGFLSGDRFDGILGGAFLRRYRVFLDYGRRELVLEENEVSGIEPRIDRSGLVLVAEGPELDRLEVHFVLPESPAARTGVRAGDRLVSVDGEPAGALGLSAARDALAERGAERRLVLERDGATREVLLHLDLEIR
jgi:hypothetical protein